jgi:hypothetical protein
MENTRIALQLTRAEALVLFDWLSRLDDGEALSPDRQAEQKVVWSLEGQLEKLLHEPLAPNYQEILDQARREVGG